MIFYDPGRWSISFAFSLKGSVFPRAFAWAGPCAFCSTMLHIYAHQSQALFDSIFPGSQASTLLSGFWAILGFLVVFRSQQAYARWWEGASLLQQVRGEWFNAFSSCLAHCSADPARQQEVDTFQHQLMRLVSLLYNCALRQVTTHHSPDFELFALDGFDISCMIYLGNVKYPVEVVLQWVQKLIIESDRAGILHVAPPILARIYSQLGRGIVGVSNARKIVEFPMPFPYTQMLTVMLICHWLLTVFMCAIVLDHWYWATILSFSVVFAFWSINYIGIELEMPFGHDENDLPLHGMMRDLNDSLIQMLHKQSLVVPSFQYIDHLHRPCSRISCESVQFAVTDDQCRKGGQKSRDHAAAPCAKSHDIATAFSMKATQKSSFTAFNFPSLSSSTASSHKRYKDNFAWKEQLSTQSEKQAMGVPVVATNSEEHERVPAKKCRIADDLDDLDTTNREGAISLSAVEEQAVELPRSVNQKTTGCPSPSSVVVPLSLAAAPSSQVDCLPNLSAALPELSRLVEAQVRELNYSIKALKGFSDALPLVIETLLSANIKVGTPRTMDKKWQGAPLGSAMHGSVNSDPNSCLAYSAPARRTTGVHAQGLSPCATQGESRVPASSNLPHVCCRHATWG